MNTVLEYKGYRSKIEFDAESMVFHGIIEGISDLVMFESDKAERIEEAFHDAVDDYILFCEDVGKNPNYMN